MNSRFVDYNVEILHGKSFDGAEYSDTDNIVLDRNDTAVVTLYRQNGNWERVFYGVVEPESLSQLIANGEQINLNRVYIKGFSYNQSATRGKEIISLSAIDAFIDGDTNFKHAKFADGNINFLKAKFVNVSFNSAKFGIGHAIFSETQFQYGDFSLATFGNGHVTFHNSNLIDVDFSNTDFGHGDVNFADTEFEKVDFSFAKFGNGNVSFYRSRFFSNVVNFAGANFGDGDISFANARFKDKTYFTAIRIGHGDVWFDEAVFDNVISFENAEFGDGNISFMSTEFSNELLSFSGVRFCNGIVNFNNVKFPKHTVFDVADFGKGYTFFKGAVFRNKEIVFNGVTFGKGTIDFADAECETLCFNNCSLAGYIDLKYANTVCLMIINSEIDSVLDIKSTPNHEVPIKTLLFRNVGLTGRIYIDWKLNHVKDMIRGFHEYNSLTEQAEQFRLLKENFRNLGQYEDEDKAYLEFKRVERLATYYGENPELPIWWARLTNPFKVVIMDWVGHYGTSPRNVMVSMLTTIVIFTFLYSLPFCDYGPIKLFVESTNLNKLCMALYLSIETFFTIGYGDVNPINIFTVLLSGAEGFIGAFLMSYFTVAFVRKVLR